MSEQESFLFKDLYHEYLLFAKNQLKKQSFDSLIYNFNAYILPYFKDNDIRTLKKRNFLEWKSKIIEFEFGNSYNNTLYVTFNGFLNYCVNLEYIPKNLLKELGNFKKKYEKKKFDFYTLKEFNKFIKGFDNEIYKQYFNVLFYTGLRPGEAMALKFSDIEGNYLNINKNIQRKGKRLLDTPKNVSSIRKVRIDDKLKKDLLNLHKLYNTNDKDIFIFGGLKPLSPTTIDRYKLKACQKMNIRPITQHQFRHSHATLLQQNGVIINEVSRRLGHSKVSTTLDIYTHTNLEQEKRVCKILNSLRFKSFDSLIYNFKTLFKHHF